ncbi:putative porin [Pseudopedobacter beijingensis]|uniref:Porin n=1 Tax=Pseudopedobacter beijingensis TaxID=1207056 RepID=A0ABW4IFT6_9SPHI
MLRRIIIVLFFITYHLTAYSQFGRGFGTNNGNNNNRDNFGFDTVSTPRSNKDISVDSLRKQLDAKKDSVVYTAKFIKYSKLEFLQDSTILFPLDTTTTNFQHFNPLNDPHSPTMNLGVMGMAYRPMLFEPRQSIGFDLGRHFFDRYIEGPMDVKYYQARARYTELYYISPFGGKQEEKFHALHSQNIKPNWNVGAKYAKQGSQGYYAGQISDILNASIWNWYESKNKRYTLLASATFNTIKSNENGSILNDSIFTVPTYVQPIYEQTRLYDSRQRNNARHDVRNNTIFIRQFFNIGKQSVVNNEEVLPTQRVSYTFSYNTQKYYFRYGRPDESGLLKNYYIYQDSTSDSTRLNHLRNEFNYSFYLRGKRLSFLKNELKINAGLVQDYYNYREYTYSRNFQNLTLKGNLTYGLNQRANLNLKLEQVFQGPYAGDFLYQANSEIKLSNNVGSVFLGAYSQNQSPALIYEIETSNHHRWNLNFDRTKTQNLSFAYVNPKFHLKAKAEYFLIGNYMYFTEINNDIYPAQFGSNINLLKLTFGKDFHFGKFTFENYLVYQKTDFESVLRTPEFYSFHSLYMHQDVFKVLKMEFGFDAKYFSQYTANAYAPAIGQFYNKDNTQFGTGPIVDAWMRTNWKRANLFLRYDYLNKGLFSKGYYTIDRYPMPYSLLRFGLSWNFYD